MAQINHIYLLRSGEVLTLEKLNSLQPHTVFQMGKAVTVYKTSAMGFNGGIDPSKTKEYRWIAKTGGANDWAIYYGDGSLPIQKIADEGTKHKEEEIIKSLVKCEPEAFKKYRF